MVQTSVLFREDEQSGPVFVSGGLFVYTQGHTACSVVVFTPWGHVQLAAIEIEVNYRCIRFL